MDAGGGGTSSYRVTRALVLRLAGPVVAVLGLVWIAVALLDLGGVTRAVLPAATAVVVVGLGWLVAWPPRVLELSPDGYRVRLVRGVGVAGARWDEVDSVETRIVGGSGAVVFSLADGRSSLLPTRLLGARALIAQRDIHTRLNAAFGYRRLERG